MTTFKSIPSVKIIAGREIKTSDLVVTNNENYTTNGESVVVCRDVDLCRVHLDHTTTDHITIKAMTNVIVYDDDETTSIDDVYDEIELSKGACVELRFIIDKWYIMSSDGLKNS
jgi:hypothetical protein